ncbi:MAG: EAL domain-containing protein [Candidatus Izemoplasmatales bacterium]|nr:EAL domain-containing protein [Candidatus Izemoplasmatales bacterium]
MGRKEEKRVSLSRRIISLTVFVNVIFLIIVSAGFMFYTFFSINQNKTQLVQNQTQAIVSSTEKFLSEIKADVDLLTKNQLVIDYLNYVNDGFEPIVTEEDPNYHIYHDFLAIITTLVEHQPNQAYNLIFVATEYNCLDASDGCAITSTGQLLYDTWYINQRPWFQDLGESEEKFTSPYEDALTGEYTFTYVKRVIQNDVTIGYVGIDMSLSNLGVLVDSIDKDINGEVAEMLVFTDFDDDPRLVFFNKDKYTDYSMLEKSQFMAIDDEKGFSETGINNLVESYQESGILNTKIFDSNYLVTFNSLEEFDWQILILIDNNRIVSMELLFGAILLLITLLVYLTALLLNRRIKRTLAPIHKILESLEEIKNGNYKVKVNLIENNEIKEIGDAINLMSKEIERQVDLVYETFAYDTLTGLKNISAARIDINKNILSGNKKAAVCIFQVENIKNINIIKGQIVGDNLLKTIAIELKTLLGNSEYIYANGHDEFIYIMNNINSLENVENNISRILAYFKEPLTVRNIKLEVKFYIGISVYPTDGNVLDDLIKKGDTALYKAKQLGNKRYLFYNENIAREISYKAQVSEQLAKTIENNELYLKYQPLVDNKNELYGFEALVRWHSPILGEISPSNFIGNAEENYMIVPIGTWVLREACAMQVRLKNLFNKEFTISVNISSIQLMQYDFVETVKSIIKETDISAEYLTLELTESVFLDSTVMIEEKIADLKALGIRFSLDDFGTGYASLTYLRQIAFDNIKVDKSFIDGIFGTENDHKIVGTIVNLVHNLDMVVIAEGVESKRQYEYLKQIGTDVFQGYMISEPITEEALKAFIKMFYKIAKAKRMDVLASKY